MKKKEKSNIINSLMGFYHVVCNLHKGLGAIDDVMLRGILFTERVYQLILFHKTFTDNNKISIPKIDQMFMQYCDKFLEQLKLTDGVVKDLVDKYNGKKERIGYII